MAMYLKVHIYEYICWTWDQNATTYLCVIYAPRHLHAVAPDLEVDARGIEVSEDVLQLSLQSGKRRSFNGDMYLHMMQTRFCVCIFFT